MHSGKSRANALDHLRLRFDRFVLDLALERRAHYAGAMLPALLMLAALQSTPASPGLRVEELQDGQFRIIVTRRGSNADPAVLANAMMRVEMEMRREATRRCADRGGPVALDRGLINTLPDHRWETVQTFACRTPAAPPRVVTPAAGS